MKCPTCESSELAPRKTTHGLVYACAICGFILVEASVLEAFSDDKERFRKSFEEAQSYRLATARDCPKCGNRLQQGRSKTAGLIFTFCPLCKLFWVDFRSLAVFDRALERALHEQVQAAAEAAAPPPLEVIDDDSAKPSPLAKVLKSMAKSLDKTADRLGANVPPEILKKQEEEAKRRKDEEAKKKEAEKRKKEEEKKRKEEEARRQKEAKKIQKPKVEPQKEEKKEPVIQKVEPLPPPPEPVSQPQMTSPLPEPQAGPNAVVGSPSSNQEIVDPSPVAAGEDIKKPDVVPVTPTTVEPKPEPIPATEPKPVLKAVPVSKQSPVSKPAPLQKEKKPGFLSQLFSGPKKTPVPKPQEKPALPPSVPIGGPSDVNQEKVDPPSATEPMADARQSSRGWAPVSAGEDIKKGETPTVEDLKQAMMRSTAPTPKEKKPGFFKQLFSSPKTVKPKATPKPVTATPVPEKPPEPKPVVVESKPTLVPPKPTSTVPKVVVPTFAGQRLKKNFSERLAVWAPRVLPLGAVTLNWLTAYEFEWFYAAAWFIFMWALARVVRLKLAYSAKQFPEVALATLVQQAPTSRWGVLPVQVKGILQKGALVDGEFTVPLDRYAGWDILSILFAVSNLSKLIGQEAVIQGWQRGGKTPYLEVRELRVGTQVRKSMVRGVYWVFFILVALISGVVLYSGY